MIQTNVKIHDKFSFEFKISFISDKKTTSEEEEFRVNTWLFIPNSLQINSDTYFKDDFFKDVNSHIRFITPDFLLSDILSDNHESPKSKLLRSLHTVLKEPASDQKGEHFVHEVKMFANICKSAIRDEASRIISLPENETYSQTLLFVSTIEQIMKFYRELYPQVEQQSMDRDWIAYFFYGENYISNIVEKYCFRLMKHAKKHANYDEIKSALFSLAQHEEVERKKKKFPNLEANNPENNNWVVMQWGILKKVIESALFLNIKNTKDGLWAEQLLYSFAAGISMVFATIVSFAAQRHYEKYTVPLFFILVVSYMFKDRIKDLMRYYFSSQLGKKYFDRKRQLSIRNKEIGVIKDAVNYVSESTLPEEVFNLRKRIPIVEIENEIYNEQIILYKKLVNLSKRKMALLKGHKYQGINDITKFHLFDLTEKMSDPSIPLYLPDAENGYTSFMGEKVYPLHFIIRGESNEKVFYRKYRLLFNRNGIQKMEEFS